jgi:hypothetical protein
MLNDYMQSKVSRQMESQFDRQSYDETQLFSIKIPVTHLSYYNSTTTFERVDGQIEINGIPYQYVKRRILNDSLELLCVPNHMALKLRLASNDYFKLMHGVFAGKVFVSDDYTIADGLAVAMDEWTLAPIERSYPPVDRIPASQLPTDERPPDSRI